MKMNNNTINIKIDLYPWQSDTLKLMEEHKGKTIVVKSRRQVGKSILCEFAALKYCLSYSHTNVFYILPTFKQSSKVFNEIADLVTNKFFTEKINNSTFTIKFMNGSTFQMFSGQMSIAALQGWTVKKNGLLIIDEMAYLSEDVIQTCMPWLNANNPTLLCVSTPLFEQGAFYDFWCQGIDTNNKEVYAIDFSKYDTSMLLTSNKLEYYRRTLPAIKFKQMYEGEFASAEGSVFGDFSQCLRQAGTPVKPYKYCNFGIDWSTGQGMDSTSITIISDNKEVIDIVHFNDKDSIQTVEIIANLAMQYQPKKITAEKNSIGNVFLDLLRKTFREKHLDIPIVPFTTTNDTKYQLVSQLQVAIQNNDIIIPNDDEIKLELMKYEMTVSGTNKPVFNACSGFHDDCLVSLMIALDSILTKKKSTFI